MKKHLGIMAILVVMNDGHSFQLAHPERLQELYLVSMPWEFGAHGIGVWSTEADAQDYIDHIYDDSTLRADRAQWEHLHNVELSKHTIRKISGTSIVNQILLSIEQDLVKEVTND